MDVCTFDRNMSYGNDRFLSACVTENTQHIKKSNIPFLLNTLKARMRFLNVFTCLYVFIVHLKINSVQHNRQLTLEECFTRFENTNQV